MTKGIKGIFSVATLVSLLGCSTFSREEKAEYKEWIESSDGQMVSIHVWNQKYRQGRRQRAKLEDAKQEKRRTAEYEEWKQETNGGLIYDSGTGRKIACGRDRWVSEIRDKWLAEKDSRARAQSAKDVMERMEREEDAEKSPEERMHDVFEKKSADIMSKIADRHVACLICGFRFGMSEDEAYHLIEKDGGQTGGGERIWQYGILKKPFRLFDRVQLCFLHGRLCSLKLLISKDIDDVNTARSEWTMVERLIEKKFGAKFIQGDQQMLGGGETVAMGLLFGNRGVDMALNANEQERKARRLTTGDIVFLHRGALNLEVRDVRLETELEDVKKRIEEQKKRARDNMNGLILNAEDGSDVL